MPRMLCQHSIDREQRNIDGRGERPGRHDIPLKEHVDRFIEKEQWQ